MVPTCELATLLVWHHDHGPMKYTRSCAIYASRSLRCEVIVWMGSSKADIRHRPSTHSCARIARCRYRARCRRPRDHTAASSRSSTPHHLEYGAGSDIDRRNKDRRKIGARQRCMSRLFHDQASLNAAQDQRIDLKTRPGRRSNAGTSIAAVLTYP